MKNLKETTKKINELANLTKEDPTLLLNRVGSHLFEKIDSLNQKKENNIFALDGSNIYSFLAGGLPPKGRIRNIRIIEVEIAQ